MQSGKMLRVSMVTRKMKTPEVATPGFSIPFEYGGLDHRLVTDYLSLSSHLQTRWLITPAATAIIRDVIVSIWTPPSCSQYRRR